MYLAHRAERLCTILTPTLQYLYHASANQPVKYIMLMNVLDSKSNLREYFQYLLLLHRFLTLCQILSQCPADKQEQLQILSLFNTELRKLLQLSIPLPQILSAYAHFDSRVCSNVNHQQDEITDSRNHSVNNRPEKRLTLVARLPPAFYIVPHAGWNYGIVSPFSWLKIGT